MNRKRRDNLIQVLVLLLFGGLVVFSLVMPALPAASSKRSLVEVSVLMREAESSIWSHTRMGMEQAAYDLGGELRFLTPDFDNSYTAQSTMLLREIQGGTDTLVVVPVDPTATERLLEEYAAELPVVSIESQLSTSRSSSIVPDNTALGRELAAVCGVQEQPILLLDTLGINTGVHQRLQSCTQALREAGNQVIIQQLQTAEIPEELIGLVDKTSAGVVIAFEPSATEALADQYGDLPKGITLYGVGGTARIVAALEQGSIKGVAAWSDYAVGYLAVQAAIHAKRNIRVEHSDYRVRFSFVKGEDIYEEDNQKLLFPVVN